MSNPPDSPAPGSTSAAHLPEPEQAVGGRVAQTWVHRARRIISSRNPLKKLDFGYQRRKAHKVLERQTADDFLQAAAIASQKLGGEALGLRYIVDLEVQRLERDRRIAALIAHAVEMVVEPSWHDAALNKNTIEYIERCGNAIDTFYNSTIVSRVFHFDEWVATFSEIADKFSECYQEKMKDSFGDRFWERLFKADFEEKNEALQGLFAGEPSLIKEKDVRAKILMLKLSPTSLLEPVNESKLREVLEVAGAIDTVDKSFSHMERIQLDPGLRTKLGTELQQQIASNLDRYKALLAVKMKTNPFNQTSRTIGTLRKSPQARKRLSTVGVDRVNDDHLRRIWKIFKLSSMVPTVYFVAAVRRTVVHDLESSELPREKSILERLVSSLHNVSRPERPALHDVPTEEWCLNYLRPSYVPAMQEAFDKDNNGFVKVDEANAYTQSILPYPTTDPASLRLFVWRLVFSAAGWHVEMFLYRSRIRRLLNKMITFMDRVLDSNIVLLRYHLDRIIPVVTPLVMGLSIPSDVLHTDRLAELVQDHMKFHDQQFISWLALFNYDLPTVHYVAALFDQDRVEEYLFPLICLILQQAAEIMENAVDAEITEPCDLGLRSLKSIVEKVSERMIQLENSFGNLGQRTDVQFGVYAKGLYANYRHNVSVYQEAQAEHHLWSMKRPKREAELEALWSPESDSIAQQEAIAFRDPTSQSEHWNFCDECKVERIVGVRYNCLDCVDQLNYDFCAACVSDLPSHTAKLHELNHNMMVYPRDLPTPKARWFFFDALNYLKNAIPVRNPLYCGNCGDLLLGDFYCCVTCAVNGEQTLLCGFDLGCAKEYVQAAFEEEEAQATPDKSGAGVDSDAARKKLIEEARAVLEKSEQEVRVALETAKKQALREGGGSEEAAREDGVGGAETAREEGGDVEAAFKKLKEAQSALRKLEEEEEAARDRRRAAHNHTGDFIQNRHNQAGHFFAWIRDRTAPSATGELALRQGTGDYGDRMVDTRTEQEILSDLDKNMCTLTQQMNKLVGQDASANSAAPNSARKLVQSGDGVTALSILQKMGDDVAAVATLTKELVKRQDNSMQTINPAPKSEQGALADATVPGEPRIESTSSA